MPNKSHFNSAHIALNAMNKTWQNHNSYLSADMPSKTKHALYIQNSIEFLSKVPDNSVQLVLIDPPYNLELDTRDTFDNYLEWAKQWLDHIYRILKDSGNCVIFWWFQYQDLKHWDLLEILHYTRHNTKLRFINMIIWHYPNWMSAHRFFANRHEEAIWLSKTKNYYFDLDSVRVPYDPEAKKAALKDKRLNPENVEKWKNPTNVWDINRLNANDPERVWHLTQKPVSIIRRFVKSLSYPWSLVLDFFAWSGTTWRVCIEEWRNSILVDNDIKTVKFFNKHINNINVTCPSFEIIMDADLNNFIETLN